ncbi:glucosaminidase domain-containing protein [Paenibacillus sp. J5C_2022]|uniref:glycoside hydrolase family 73 protein n=1 Tax=Paenibacillus sp. J5C2022 TaxID=2977129 RepID=UPI0021D2314E|nr:glucosaminidase domain-containing protein [Paenibacillus sp. J5C2022]MCU6708914.1 glucosaminidase domain-containing protein [Paenibacillus sp. J5C2022]
MAKLTRAQFIKAIAPTIMQVRLEGSPMYASLRIAQSILETGGVIHAWNNLGGIKVGSGKPNAYWQGEAVVKGTWEVVDGRSMTTKSAFRAYRSLYHFYKDLDRLLEYPRYEPVRRAPSPEKQATMLQSCGYATDPAYASKLISLINRYRLKAYDIEVSAPVRPLGFEGSSVIPILYLGGVIGTGYLKEGTTWVPVQEIGGSLGATVGSCVVQGVTVNGMELQSVKAGALRLVKVRELADAAGIELEWDGKARVVMLG